MRLWGILLQRRRCLKNLIQQIGGLWAEVNAVLDPNTKVGICVLHTVCTHRCVDPDGGWGNRWCQ